MPLYICSSSGTFLGTSETRPGSGTRRRASLRGTQSVPCGARRSARPPAASCPVGLASVTRFRMCHAPGRAEAGLQL